MLYQQLDSLTDYLLVSQSMPRIEHYARQENGLWLPRQALGMTASITLRSIGLNLHLSEVYESVEFPRAII